jgi:hypothetical protein
LKPNPRKLLGAEIWLCLTCLLVVLAIKGHSSPAIAIIGTGFIATRMVIVFFLQTTVNTNNLFDIGARDILTSRALGRKK